MPNILSLLPSICLILLASSTFVGGFSSHQFQGSQTKHLMSRKYRTLVPPTSQLQMLDESNDEVEKTDDGDNFDGKGFANYLGPYAIALVGSIAVTAAFVKFVLMDY
mmetsp:Transcript_1516/g.3871  ORF Transcript_1516/g.3871 Transcript_1516/m.3871 type:complete len:107 (+) Transcript_1516:247-567(+)|eukprot:CAMPEP_0181078390 /NCGR_PEP_ID=MMETSP1071-20121207/1461_1 /TAXON_ID=35127 /ORGANISM="Thalassiosira sp., Strain NH16" /LENGTH=106 /DNA_ID=CAMNT_0023159703 /DNA_START=189 /DNA_END=509 /DNA_ORIENTATION=+